MNHNSTVIAIVEPIRVSSGVEIGRLCRMTRVDVLQTSRLDFRLREWAHDTQRDRETRFVRQRGGGSVED